MYGCFWGAVIGKMAEFQDKGLSLLGMMLALTLLSSPFCMKAALAAEKLEMTINVDGESKAYSAQRLRLFVNGNELSSLEMPPIELDGLRFVPAEDALQSLGAVATWNAISGDMLINLQGKLMILTVGADNANINARRLTMPAPAKLVNGKMMVPESFFCDTIGLNVTWDDTNRIIHVWDSSKIADPTQGLVHTGTAQQPSNAVNMPSNASSGTGTGRPTDVSVAPIKAMDYPATKITGIQTTPGGDFIINAKSEISSAETLVISDGRIVVDISNAEFDMDTNIVKVEHPTVTQVRVAQNQITPTMITRVVFDVTAASDFSVSISADRKSLVVSFMKNAVLDITFSSDGKTDTLTLVTQRHAALNIYPLTDPQRIVIDAPNSDMKKIIRESTNGRFVSVIYSESVEPLMARIVLELKANAAFEMVDQGNTVKIVIFEPTYKNITYNAETRTIRMEKPKGIMFDINTIAHLDEYNDLRYTLTMPVSFESTIGHGEYVIKDDILHSFVVKDEGDKTQVVLYEKKILAVNITEDSANIYIKLMEPHEKYERIVVIDPGHGGRDPGVPHSVMNEKEIVLDIATKAIALLEREGTVKAYATRLTDVYPSLYERAEFADAVGDLFVSVHINSSEYFPTANGTEVHFYPHDNDGTVGISSKQVSEILLKHLLEKLGTNNRNLKQTDYVVLRNSVPSALIEIAFLTNASDAQRILTDQFRTQAAEAIYSGILEIFGTYKPKR